jgi:HD-like signal output (HDOD) protein
MSDTLRDGLKKRVERLRSLPSSPAVLNPLLELLRSPSEKIDLKKVVQLVSYDETIAAQCLRMANSALYGRAKETESVRAAVLSLGIQRVEDILLTCCLHRLSKGAKWGGDPSAFWRHSLGCAAVTNELALRIGYPDPDRAYLAGLLHDLGILVNSLAYPDEYENVLLHAAEKGVPLGEQESAELGFTHSESGNMLAALWQLPPPISEVIKYHHELGRAPVENRLVPLVHISDQLCRTRALGYGYEEWRVVDLTTNPAWELLAKQCPKLKNMDMARFTMDLDSYLPRVQTMVDAIFITNSEHKETANTH